MINTTLTTEAVATLKRLLHVLQDLNLDEYTEKLPLLGDSSIGEHTRHIIELFQVLKAGYSHGVINYDDRQRDVRIQTNIDVAMEAIAHLISDISQPNKDLILHTLNHNNRPFSTNYDRELLYNIEHCIHHQAIIRIGLSILEKNTGDEAFGVAPSTLLYRRQQ